MSWLGLNGHINPKRPVYYLLLLEQVPDKQRECLSYVSTIEESMVKGMAFEVPKEYANLPQLLVRECALRIGQKLLVHGPPAFTFTASSKRQQDP